MKNITTIGFLALTLLVGCVGKDEATGAKTVGASVEDIKTSHVFKLELSKNEQGVDVLLLTTEDLPNLEPENAWYDLYVCWIDEPAPYPGERRIEMRGNAKGENGKSVFAMGLTDILGIEGNTYYGRGRVCAILVSDQKSFISNVVRIPDKPNTTAVEADTEEISR